MRGGAAAGLGGWIARRWIRRRRVGDAARLLAICLLSPFWCWCLLRLVNRFDPSYDCSLPMRVGPRMKIIILNNTFLICLFVCLFIYSAEEKRDFSWLRWIQERDDVCGWYGDSCVDTWANYVGVV
jgi:hypothetical protein